MKHSFKKKKKKGSFCLSLCLTGLNISDLQRETGRKTEWEPVKGGQVRSLHLQVKAVVVGEEGAGEWPTAAEQGVDMKKKTTNR